MKFKFRRYYLYYLARVAAFNFSLLPLSIGLYIAGLGGCIAFLVLPKYRRIAIENLTSVFAAEKGRHEIIDVARRVFENLAKNGVELINFRKINKGNIARFVRIRNPEVVDRCLENGKGVIVITGHFGNWELLALAFKLKGHTGGVMARRIYFERYNDYLTSFRGYHGIETVYRDESPKKALRILKNNGILGILADQDVDSVDGVFVNFFGRPAYTPRGPVALAMASGAPLVPAFIIRKNGCHELVVEEPIKFVDTGDKERDMIANTQAWSDVVESYIRKYPEQWVWMHRRWKTQK